MNGIIGGKYVEPLRMALAAAKAEAGALLIFDGEGGPGFCMRTGFSHLVSLPAILRILADKIEQDLHQADPELHDMPEQKQ